MGYFVADSEMLPGLRQSLINYDFQLTFAVGAKHAVSTRTEVFLLYTDSEDRSQNLRVIWRA